MALWDDLFGDPGTATLQSAIETLATLPVPPIDHPSAKALYAFVWGFSIVSAIATGGIAAVLHLRMVFTRTGNLLKVADAAAFFLKVTVVGFVAPLVVGFLLLLSHTLGMAAMYLPSADPRPGWLQALHTIANLANPASGGVLLGVVNWVLEQLYTRNVAIMSLGVIPMLSLAPFFYGFSILGRPGLFLWRVWVGLLLVTITAKPVMIWMLVVGRIAAELSTISTVPANFSSVIALMTLEFSSVTPLALAFLYITALAPRLQPASVRVSSDKSSGTSRLALGASAGAATAATAFAQRKLNTKGSGRSPGARRTAASRFFDTGAVTVGRAYPAVGGALKVASTITGMSARRASSRSGSSSSPTGRPTRPHR